MEQIRAVILAAGRSERLGTADKLWVAINGKPLIQWSIEAFDIASEISGITLVTREESRINLLALVTSLRTHKPIDIVIGGPTRMESVYHACMTIDDEYIAVHDGARPLITSELIDNVCLAARNDACACLSLPVVETLVRTDNDRELERVDRSQLYALQTPQVIRRDVWMNGHDIARSRGIDVTDDTHMATLTGNAVKHVIGHKTNIKVTYAEDIDFVQQMMNTSNQREYRTGHGYDIHRTDSDRACYLGGVLFEDSPTGLLGHSDADVLLHAICDALLGATSLGDIGLHFPPSDNKHKDRPSTEFLVEVKELIKKDRWLIGNIDATVIAEAPKIMPKAFEIRKHISGILEIPIDAVSVKATTNERLGALGQGDGIAAHVVAMVYR